MVCKFVTSRDGLMICLILPFVYLIVNLQGLLTMLYTVSVGFYSGSMVFFKIIYISNQCQLVIKRLDITKTKNYWHWTLLHSMYFHLLKKEVLSLDIETIQCAASLTYLSQQNSCTPICRTKIAGKLKHPSFPLLPCLMCCVMWCTVDQNSG